MEDEIIDLLDNPEFKSWVWHPNESSNCYWNRVIADSPEKHEPIQKAKAILLALTSQFKEQVVEQATIEIMLINILAAK